MSWLKRLIGLQGRPEIADAASREADRKATEIDEFGREMQRCLAPHYESDDIRRFFEAVQNNDTETIARILDRSPLLVDMVGIDCPAIWEAAREGYLDVVQLLIDRGANLDACDSFGRTALHIAASHESGEVYVEKRDYPGIVELLLSAGCNPNPLDDEGQTPLDGAGDAVMTAILTSYGGLSADGV